MHRVGLAKAIRYIGSQEKLAGAIGGGVHQKCVSNWLNRDKKLSLEKAVKIEQVTHKYVTISELAPDKSWIVEYIQDSVFTPHLVKLSNIKLENIPCKVSNDISILANDIKHNGLNRPIAITPNKNLIYGYKRLIACQQLKFDYIASYIVNPKNFLNGMQQVHGLISHCTLSERVAIGQVIEPFILSLKSNTVNSIKAKKIISSVRPDINIDGWTAEQIISSLLNFDDKESYKNIKSIISQNCPQIITALDHREISIEKALSIVRSNKHSR